MTNLKPCPFCGERPVVIVTTRGSTIRCSACSAKMELKKSAGHYKNLAMARKWTYRIIEEEWNTCVETKGD